MRPAGLLLREMSKKTFGRVALAGAAIVKLFSGRFAVVGVIVDGRRSLLRILVVTGMDKGEL